MSKSAFHGIVQDFPKPKGFMLLDLQWDGLLGDGLTFLGKGFIALLDFIMVE